jgi:hypothetical protein
MAYQQINYGATPDDSNADSVRDAGIKIDSNFQEVYSLNSAGSPLVGVQNRVWATGNGSDTAASFRALVNADIPSTLSGKTLTSATLTSPTITSPTITSPTITGATLTTPTLTTPTITGGTITNATITNSNIASQDLGRIQEFYTTTLGSSPIDIDLSTTLRKTLIMFNGLVGSGGSIRDMRIQLRDGGTTPSFTVNHRSWSQGSSVVNTNYTQDGTLTNSPILISDAGHDFVNLSGWVECNNFNNTTPKYYRYQLFYLDTTGTLTVTNGAGMFTYAGTIDTLRVYFTNGAGTAFSAASGEIGSYGVEV